jgi:hypothetical protein
MFVQAEGLSNAELEVREPIGIFNVRGAPVAQHLPKLDVTKS